MVWRGVTSHRYTLYSSLFRAMTDKLGLAPQEQDLLEAERLILKASRHLWRFDNLTALETMAQLQHYGAATRLLDVTYNPWIALWFAIEQRFDEHSKALPDEDGRLFAFDVTHRNIDLAGTWGTFDIPWDWDAVGRGPKAETWFKEPALVWRPPSYNARIPAQNSAFLIGGVPKTSGGSNARFYRKYPGARNEYWSIDEVRSVTSVNVSLNNPNRKAHPSSIPTFVIRIPAEAKPYLRRLLEFHFGFNMASVYPDLYGLARYSNYFAVGSAKVPSY